MARFPWYARPAAWTTPSSSSIRATLKGTGFKFREYSGEAMLDSLKSAIALYRDNPDAWRVVMRNGMAQDYSWMNSAREYLKVYDRARQLKQQAAG